MFVDKGTFTEAKHFAVESVRIGEESNSPYLQNYYNNILALAHLLSNDLANALAAAETARKYDVPQNNHNVAVLLGIIALRQNDVAAAQETFTAAIAHADKLLAQTPEFYDALDAKGVALCGLALCDAGRGEAFASARLNDQSSSANASPLRDTIAAFRAARTISKDAGIVARVVRLLDALALADPQGAEKLAEARKATSGE